MRRPVAIGLTALLVLALVPLARAASAAAAPCDTAGTPTTTVYLPNITKTLGGPTGWVTPFIVQNVGSTTTTLEVSFYRFADGGLVTCRKTAALQPGTSFADVPNNDQDLPDDSQFAVVVRSFGSQVVAVVNEHQGAGDRAEALSYGGLSSGATRVGLPYVAKSAGGWLVTFVMQNLGSADTTVTASFANADGTRIATLTRTIGPGRSQFVNPAVEPSLVDGTEYAVVLTSTQPIAVVVNAHNDAPTAEHPMGFSYNGLPVGTPAQTYLPYLARNTDGIGRTSRIVVQNVGAADATPSLTFTPYAGGAPVTIRPSVPIRAGRSWSFDPRMAADGATPCPASGGVCVAEGEHALVVGAGTFAVLGVVLSPATAMGYTGAVPAPSRVYLPNVTRTLGGPAGWTTPIIVQSAGATSASLRWFRFSDGSLITRQTVPLTINGSVRVDPRTVSALADDTQYAVVVDAPGPVTAIVVELNAMGGDAAMIYEGFAGTQSAAPVPTIVAVTPASISLQRGQLQQFTATVQDQFGTPLGGQVPTWSVSPPALGSISPGGLFNASGGGTGTVIASITGATGSAAVTIQVPSSVTIGGQSFRVTATTTSDVSIETTITTAEAQSILALVDPDATYVQTAFAKTFAQRPQLYAFANMTSLQAGWLSVMGSSGAAPTDVLGVYVFSTTSGTTGKIALNWDGMKKQKPYRTVRHELTHMMIHQVTGANVRLVPTWFNEGWARLTDLTEPSGEWREAESRYTAASMAATGTLFAITLTDAQFTALGATKNNAYYEGAETIRLMRADLGNNGLLGMLDAMKNGRTFNDSYTTFAGRPFTPAFTQERPARLAALAASPGVATEKGSYLGAGFSYFLYGYPPRSTVTVEITGSDVRGGGARQIDEFGYYSGVIATGWPPGTYTVSATGPSGQKSTTTGVVAASILGQGSVAQLSIGELPVRSVADD